MTAPPAASAQRLAPEEDALDRSLQDLTGLLSSSTWCDDSYGANSLVLSGNGSFLLRLTRYRDAGGELGVFHEEEHGRWSLEKHSSSGGMLYLDDGHAARFYFVNASTLRLVLYSLSELFQRESTLTACEPLPALPPETPPPVRLESLERVRATPWRKALPLDLHRAPERMTFLANGLIDYDYRDGSCHSLAEYAWEPGGFAFAPRNRTADPCRWDGDATLFQNSSAVAFYHANETVIEMGAIYVPEGASAAELGEFAGCSASSRPSIVQTCMLMSDSDLSTGPSQRMRLRVQNPWPEASLHLEGLDVTLQRMARVEDRYEPTGEVNVIGRMAEGLTLAAGEHRDLELRVPLEGDGAHQLGFDWTCSLPDGYACADHHFVLYLNRAL